MGLMEWCYSPNVITQESKLSFFSFRCYIHIQLFQAVKIFINTADDSDDVPNIDKHQQKYASYCVSETELDLLAMIQKVSAVCISCIEDWEGTLTYLLGSS
jgi:hypothetical protein